MNPEMSSDHYEPSFWICSQVDGLGDRIGPLWQAASDPPERLRAARGQEPDPLLPPLRPLPEAGVEPAMRREHVQAPDDPENGYRFECWCGEVAEFVVLDDGQPGEWVSTEGEAKE